MSNTLNTFYIVGEAGLLNDLTHRFTTYAAAETEARRLSALNPYGTYLILKLVAYSNSNITITVNVTELEQSS